MPVVSWSQPLAPHRRRNECDAEATELTPSDAAAAQEAADKAAEELLAQEEAEAAVAREEAERAETEAKAKADKKKKKKKGAECGCWPAQKPGDAAEESEAEEEELLVPGEQTKPAKPQKGQKGQKAKRDHEEAPAEPVTTPKKAGRGEALTTPVKKPSAAEKTPQTSSASPLERQLAEAARSGRSSPSDDGPEDGWSVVEGKPPRAPSRGSFSPATPQPSLMRVIAIAPGGRPSPKEPTPAEARAAATPKRSAAPPKTLRELLRLHDVAEYADHRGSNRRLADQR